MGDRERKHIPQGPIEIRRAETTDAQAIADCLQAAFAQHRDQYTPKAYADTVLQTDGVLRRMREMYLLVAVAGGRIIGTIGCLADASEGHLRGMAVLPAWQGTGVAADLLGAAEAELRKNGCSVVTLDTTEPLLRAIRFYTTHGYSASGHVTDFFGMPLYEYRKLLL